MKEPLKMRSTVTMGRWWDVPLKWQVVKIEDQKALLVCKKVVDMRPFEVPSKDSFWVYEIWEKTDLRRWLNGTFYNNAFKEEEKGRIIQSEVVTVVDREGETIETEKTMDHVFTLSDLELFRYVTKKGILCKALKYDDDDEYWERTSGYWLRSRGDNFMSAYWAVDFVDKHGDIYYNEGNPYDDKGVRPAMWIKIEN